MKSSKRTRFQIEYTKRADLRADKQIKNHVSLFVIVVQPMCASIKGVHAGKGAEEEVCVGRGVDMSGGGGLVIASGMQKI